MMLRRLLLFFILSIGLTVAAQIQTKDSLAVFLATEVKDSAFVVKLNSIAFDYLKFDPAQGRKLAQLSADIAQNINFLEGYSRALNVIGSTYWVTGDYEQALRHYQISARESAAIEDASGLSAAYHNMGEVYKKVGNYNKAIEYLKYSLELDIKKQSSYAITFFNIGEAQLFLQQYDSALVYFEKASLRASSENDHRTMAYVLQNKGKIKYLTGQFPEALPLYEKATSIWKAEDDIRSLIMVYQDFANTYLALNRLDKAEEYTQQSSQLATTFKAMNLQVENYKIESDIRRRKKDFQGAFDMLNKHNALKDSVYDLKKSEQIALLQASFESESQGLENKQLKADQLIKDDRIRTQQYLIIGISIISILAIFMAWVNFRQHRKLLEVNVLLTKKNKEIEDQKTEIETQAEKLAILNTKLSNLNASLENRIEVRTSQLKNQNHKLAEFAFMNAHQLRAPIARTVGLINLIQKIELPEDDQVLINYLENCGKELDQITKDISRSLEDDSLFIDNKDE